ncbi:MAG TPA: MFS transporter [Ktedonobacterales bacterium]
MPPTAMTSAPPPRRDAPITVRVARGALFTTALLDELTTGLLVVALPLIRDRLRLSYAEAGLIFTVGALSSVLIEPPITLAADRRPLRVPILAGMLALAAGYALAGLAPNYALLLAAVALIFPAIGTAVGLAQSALIDAAPPHQAGRTMARWTLLSAVGDLLAPLAVGVGVAAGMDWLGLCLIAGCLWLASAFVLAPACFPSPHGQGELAGEASSDERDGLRSRLRDLRDALRDRELLRWAAISTLATTLDEVFLAFAALYLHDHLHASQEAISTAIAVAVAAGLAALVLLDHLGHRVEGRRLLPWMAVLALLGVVLLLLVPTVPLAVLALAVVAFAAAGWYPLAQAAAYASGYQPAALVRTVSLLGDPIEVVLPGVTGLIAARFGLSAALAFLALGPLAMLVLLPRRHLS